MTILLFIGRPIPFAGAAWTRVSSLARALCKKGEPVELLGSFTLKSYKKRGTKRYDGVIIRNLVPSINHPDPIVFLLNCIMSLIFSFLILAIRRPKITVISIPPGDAGIGTMLACRILRLKYAVDYRDQWDDYQYGTKKGNQERPHFLRIVKLVSLDCYKSASLVSAVTERFVSILENMGVNDVHLIENGADINIFKPASKKNGQGLVLVYTGGIGSYYKVETIIHVMNLLVIMYNLKVKLVLAGAGNINQILSLAKELQVLDCIEYRGIINTPSKLAEIIGNSDIGIIPYDDNPLWINSVPVKLFEYSACGLPVLATALDGSLLCNIIHSNQIGLCVHPNDLLGFAKAVYQFLADEPFRMDTGKRGRDWVKRHHDRSNIAKRYLKLINELLV